jgi:hypothetical protein
MKSEFRKIVDFLVEWYHEHPHDHDTAWFKGYIAACYTNGQLTEDEQDEAESILSNLTK